MIFAFQVSLEMDVISGHFVLSDAERQRILQLIIAQGFVNNAMEIEEGLFVVFRNLLVIVCKNKT